MTRQVTAMLAALALGFASAGLAHADPIDVVAYTTTGLMVIDFEDAAAAPFPGVNYDGILNSGGARFAERFAGQNLSFSGGNDVLSGSPGGPLTLQTGAPGRNLDLGTDNGTHNLIPCGNLGCLDGNGYGEGSFAVLFAHPTSFFGFQQFFDEGGTKLTTLDFFNGAGGLIQRVTVNVHGSFGFHRSGGFEDIAGVSVFTSDLGGLAYDNLVYDPTHGDPGGVPEPATWAMLLTGFGAIGAIARRRRPVLA